MVMIIMAFVIFGIVSFTNLAIDLMPNIELPYVTVQAVYPGAGPEEVEVSVVKPIEEEVSLISGIKNIFSYCWEGVGFVVLEFNMDVDSDLAAIDVKDKVDGILYKLPDDLEKPVIGKFDINAQPIVELAFTGSGTPEALRSIADKQIKERLAKISGVASISVTAGREREIQVNLHMQRLDALDLSILQIAPVIAAQTADIPSGHVVGNTKEYTVRVQGEFESLEEIRDLKIPTMNGPVPLSSIASVEDTYKEVRELARYNNQNSVGLSVQKRPDANTVVVAEDIFRAVDRMNAELPQGFKIYVARDRSEFINNAVDDSYSSMALGILFTAAMLLLFLGDWKLTLIAAVTMPASVIITFIGIQVLGFSLNIVTLMALSISVGILVTNSIVVLENIVRHRDEGAPVREAAEIGTKEIMIAVIASTLTNIAVFLPIANMAGITGQIFKELALTIVFATVASLALSFTLTPLMASLLLKSRDTSGAVQQHRIDRFLQRVRRGYIGTLDFGLRHKWVVLLPTVIMFVLTIWRIAPRLGSEFFPQSDQGVIDISVEMPSGTSLNATNSVLVEVERIVSGLPEMESAYSYLGSSGFGGGVNSGGMVIRLKDLSERDRSTSAIVNELRQHLAAMPDAQIVLKEQSTMGPGGGGDIEVEITGDEMGEILALADSVKALAQTVPGLVDVQLSWKEAKPEIKFLPNRRRLDEYGMNVAQIGLSLRYAMTGDNSAVYREGSENYDIRVQYCECDRNSLDAAEYISISTPKGIVPAKALADVVYAGGAAGIDRKNRQRMVSVLANVSEGTTGIKAAELKRLTDKMDLKPGYQIYYGGSQEMMQESFSSLIFAAMLAIILTYMVLSGILESLLQPFVIMFTLPLGLIGVIWALFLTGTAISMMSLMSVVMLIGIVVNNAILMIDYAHMRRRQGDTPRKAIEKAADNKFKPILMMNLAIVLAMLPQALSLGSGGEIRAPFAITAIGGILMSTLLTLFVIPTLYVITARKK